jgi:hypothetical protein
MTAEIREERPGFSGLSKLPAPVSNPRKAGHWLTFGKCSGDVCAIQSHNSNAPLLPPK